jgi:hypothetical protein
MTHPDTLVVIFNHALNDKAIALKQQFAPFAHIWLADSGSKIEPDQREHFDATFPNIYYNGLINELHQHISKQKSQFKTVLLITSDVTVADAGELMNRMTEAFSNPEIYVYAPACGYSYHAHMIQKPGKSLQKVTFTEGFCVGFRVAILDGLCPIDLKLNKFGYGTDTIMGFHAMNLGGISVVDHSIIVDHPYGSGYNHAEAVVEKNRWYKSLSPAAYRFARLTTFGWTKNRFGAWLAESIFRRKR